MKLSLFGCKYVCACSLACALASFSVLPSAAQKQLSTIVIDPGHGGKDPGALGKLCKEKDIVLDVSLRLGKMINDSLPEVKTIYTRSTDVFIPLSERSNIANKNGADLFISVHANWVKNNSIKGAETFVLGLHRSKENLEVAQKENSVITFEDDYTNKYEGFDPTQPESYIIFELMQNTYLEQSITMAADVQNAFVGVGRGNRGVKQAGFLVLRQSSMPSVLIELGFLSNAQEEKYMMSDEGKDELTHSIFKAFKTYKEQYDGKANVQVVKAEKTSLSVTNVSGVCFRVQVATSPKPLTLDNDGFGDVYSFTEDGRHKYAFFRAETYDEIVKLQKKAKAKYPDCFIIAFENGKKISVRAARKKTEK